MIYIRIAKPFVLPLQIFATITNKITFSQNCSESRRIWGILSAPVVANSGKKTVVSLCKFESVLIYIRIAKPFVLPLQIFATITNKITFSQNSSETRRIWALLAAPVAANSGRKTCAFPYVNWESVLIYIRIAQTLYFTVANFRHDYK